MTDLAPHPPVVDVSISPHAWARIVEMKLDRAEVIDAVREPHHDIPDKWDKHRRKATRDRVTVVYEEVGGGRKLVCTVLWAGRESDYEWHPDRADPKAKAPRTSRAAPVEEPVEDEHPRTMNEILLGQLKLWNCHEGRRSSDYVEVLMPCGGKVRVRPAEHVKETTPARADQIYELLGVTPETFWSRTTKVRPPRERLFAPKRNGSRVTAVSQMPVAPVTQMFETPDPVERLAAFRDAEPETTARRKRGRPPKGTVTYDTAVLEFFEQRPGVTFDAAAVADALGIGKGSINNACSSLYRNGRIERVGWGRYQLADEWDATDRRLAEINRELAATDDPLRRVDLVRERTSLLNGTPTDVGSEPSASVGSAGDLDGEIDSLLELLAPDGVGDRLQETVARWRDATRNLIMQLRA